MALTTTISLVLSCAQDLAAYAGQARDEFPDFSAVWPDGTGQGEADLFYYASLTLTTASLAIALDTLTDAEGNAIAFAEVRCMALRVDPAAPGAVDFVIPGTNGWDVLTNGAGDKITIQPGAIFIPCLTNLDGAYPVTPPDVDINLNRVVASDTDIQILVIGTSA